MDPNQALRDFMAAEAATEKALLRSDIETAMGHMTDATTAAASLFSWLARGGFAPDWSIVQS